MYLYIVENKKHKRCVGNSSWYPKNFMVEANNKDEAIDEVCRMCREEYPEGYIYTKEMFRAKRVEKFHEENQIDGITEL